MSKVELLKRKRKFLIVLVALDALALGLDITRLVRNLNGRDS